MGAGWIRFDLQWTNIQHSNATTWDWSAHDPVVTGATARNLKVVAVLTTSPGWANGGQAWNTPPSSAAGISAYGTFCAASAQHYGPLGVKVYEVWNEPNLSGFFQPAPNVAQYTAMLKACYAAIKQVDPSLTVLSGGLAPVGGYATGDPAHPENINQVKFLEGIYANGGKGSFDAVAVHPYSWPAPPSGTNVANAWYEMNGTSPSIRSVMTANGEASKLVWGTEFGSPSGGLSGLTETTQDLGVQDALALWKNDSWGAVLFYYAGKDGQDGGSGFFSSYGLTRADGSHKLAWASMHSLIPTS
jgi:hypothetical protein